MVGLWIVYCSVLWICFWVDVCCIVGVNLVGCMSMSISIVIVEVMVLSVIDYFEFISVISILLIVGLRRLLRWKMLVLRVIVL